MSWRMIVKPISTADNAAAIPTVYQKFKPKTFGKYLIFSGASVGLVFYNNPIFTDISLELWSDLSGPTKLIATSTNSYTKASMLLIEDHAYKIAGFSFNDLFLKYNSHYNLTLRITGYTGHDSSYIGMRQGYPDPQYLSGLDTSAKSGDNTPFEISILGSEQ